MKTQDQILEKLGVVIGKVDGINKRLDKVNGTVARHDDRINENEKKVDIMTGKATIIGAIFGFIGAVIIALFKTQ